ncbi:uncharacterized protein ACRADG_008688 [Cochliomyia hominivorax]
MVNFINLCYLLLLTLLCHLAGILTLPLENPQIKSNASLLLINFTKNQHNYKVENNNYYDVIKTAEISKNSSDLRTSATDYKPSQLLLPVVSKPRGFHLPKNRAAIEQKPKEPQQPAAQNYYHNYFPDLSVLDQAEPYYPLTEDPIIAKFLSQQNKQFPANQQAPFSSYEASILGSGDFGILKGGTFYSDEEQPFNNEESSDFYYGDASNTHSVSTTEGFIKKYTFPEDQFAQFRDFADLATPADSAFSQYVVVYAAKNSTNGSRLYSKPKNIFEQLQEIDKEKDLEQKSLRKNQTNSGRITKLKLVKTKLLEKKWVQRIPVKAIDNDPLIALS